MGLIVTFQDIVLRHNNCFIPMLLIHLLSLGGTIFQDIVLRHSNWFIPMLLIHLLSLGGTTFQDIVLRHNTCFIPMLLVPLLGLHYYTSVLHFRNSFIIRPSPVPNSKLPYICHQKFLCLYPKEHVYFIKAKFGHVVCTRFTCRCLTHGFNEWGAVQSATEVVTRGQFQVTLR